MTIDVLIVDDDYRVAEIHSRYVASVDGCRSVGTAGTAAAARESVGRLRPDLVLLDNYLPDCPGHQLAAELACDVFMVTADRSAATVRAAAQAGALNYIVKPFRANVLVGRLNAYVRYRHSLTPESQELDQAQIDHAVVTLHQADRATTPKGRSPVTARLVAQRLELAEAPLTAADVALALGISRATAQRYLSALADSGRADMAMRYGTTGRPEHLYEWRSNPAGA